jgi:hypothetical protein
MVKFSLTEFSNYRYEEDYLINIQVKLEHGMFHLKSDFFFQFCESWSWVALFF